MRIGNFACDRLARLPAHRKIGHGIEQHARIGVLRMREQVFRRRDLDDAAQIHHATRVAMCRTTARLWLMKR